MPVTPRATFDNPYGPQVTFRTEDVLPPSAYYISPEDRVTVWVLTDVLAQTIYLQLRLLMPTGELKLIPYQFSPQTLRNWTPAYELPPWEGYMLGALCWSTNPLRGQCFVSVQVMRSAPPNLTAAGIVLIQGYVSNMSVLSYPTSPLESTFSGRGAFLTITQPNETGGNLQFQAPINTLWRVCSLCFVLITSAAPGNRVVFITLLDSSNTQVGSWCGGFTQAPSLTYGYSFSDGGANATMPTNVCMAGPHDLFLPPQGSLETAINGLSATDQITNIAMLVEEWMGI